MPSKNALREQIESVRSLIHLLEGDTEVDDEGRELAHKVDEAFATLAEDLEEEPPLFV